LKLRDEGGHFIRTTEAERLSGTVSPFRVSHGVRRVAAKSIAPIFKA